MESDKKVTIGINSLNSSKFEDGKKINLIKSICKYYEYECNVYVDDDVDVDMIREDYDKGIIAKFHDESHINAYMRSHPCKILQEELNLPEELMKDSSKMIFREKTHIDLYFNKNRSFSLFSRFNKVCVIIWNVVRWYLKI